MLLRVLSVAVQSKPAHLLEAPIIRQRTAQYDRNGDRIVPIELEHSIAAPIKMLRALGIDSFSDEKFDTSVIRTIQARINDN